MASVNKVPKLADYIISDKIGSGSYGEVYKAYKKNSSGREVVAVKAVLRSSLSMNSFSHLETEIRLLKSLNHEHIVKMKEFQWDDNFVYIVMEYCSGGDLSHFIKLRRRLPEDACQRFLQQLASALKYMRDQNVSHFDLKPQNILLASRRNPLVKIGDFGLAQRLAESESTSKMKGSPLYMAPEILLEKEYDAKVDLWSVGVILYESLFGKAPYSSNTIEELIHKIKSDKHIEIPSNAAISPNCRDLLARCLERDPHKRIEFDEFFAHPFVDLEHKPSEENFDKARELLLQAVKCDKRKEYEEALSLYTNALRYLVPTIYVENNAAKKSALRKTAKQYLTRTEELKRILTNSGIEAPNIVIPTLPDHPNEPSEPSEQRMRVTTAMLMAEHERNVEMLLTMATTTPRMTGAVDIGKSAALYEHEGSYKIALAKYEMALGKLLALMKDEPQGVRRDLLLVVVQRWMKQAERIKERFTGQQQNSNQEVDEIENDHQEDPVSVDEKKKRRLSPLKKIIKSVDSITLTEDDYETNCNIQ